jgi:Putative beta-barrel porin-2, OmpL-like. bbp2
LLVLILSPFSLLAGEDVKLAKTLEEQGIYLETAKPGVVLSGFVDAGYTYNFEGAGTEGSRLALQDRQAKGDFNLNAFKLALEKALPEANEFAAGFRADLVYGEDANFYDGGSNGGDGLASDFAILQAYAQFRAPVGNGLDFQVGKFGGLLGFEGAERGANINITYSNMQAVIPGNPVGVMASYVVCDWVDVKLGVVNNYGGDDSLRVNGRGDEIGLTGAINIQSAAKNANIQTSFHLSPTGDSNVPGGDTQNALAPSPARENEMVWAVDQVGTWLPKFANDKLLLGYWATAGGFRYQTDTTQVPVTQGSETWAGVALYTKYQFTEVFSLAGRGDYLRGTDNQAFATASPDAIGAEIYSTTVTAGFDLWKDMLLRVEYRADWGKDAIGTNAGPSQGPAHLLATQVVYSF